MSKVHYTVLGIDPGLRFTGIAALHFCEGGVLEPGGVWVSLSEKAKGKQQLRAATLTAQRIRAHYQAITHAMDTLKPVAVGIENYTIYDHRDVEQLKNASKRLIGLLGLGGTGAVPTTASDFLRAFERPSLFEAFLTCLLDMQKALRNEASFMGTRGRGAAANTLAVYGAALGAAYARNIVVLPFAPVELKMGLCQRKSASKADVAQRLHSEIPALEAYVRDRIKAKTQHEHAYDACGHALLAQRSYAEMLGGLGVQLFDK